VFIVFVNAHLDILSLHIPDEPNFYEKVTEFRFEVKSVQKRKLPNFSKKVTEFLCESYVNSKSKQINPPQKSNH
ncbi:hypothetical protein, partial [Prevotella sp.]|uniref:hypothetical protein n=1 Tax=Prevotella sp. TaxID=59823 RepID=UPI003F80D5FD